MPVLQLESKKCPEDWCTKRFMTNQARWSECREQGSNPMLGIIRLIWRPLTLGFPTILVPRFSRHKSRVRSKITSKIWLPNRSSPKIMRTHNNFARDLLSTLLLAWKSWPTVTKRFIGRRRYGIFLPSSCNLMKIRHKMGNCGGRI